MTLKSEKIVQSKHGTDTQVSKEYWCTTASTIIHFKKMPTNKNKSYLLLMFKGKTFHSWISKEWSIENQRHENLSLSVDTRTNLSLWTTKLDSCCFASIIPQHILLRYFQVTVICKLQTLIHIHRNVLHPGN